MCPLSSKGHKRPPLSRNLLAGLPLARLLSVVAVSQLSHSPAAQPGTAGPLQWAGRVLRPSGSLTLSVCLLSSVPVTLEERTVISVAADTPARGGSSLVCCAAHYVITWRPQIHVCPTGVHSCWPQFMLIIILCRKLGKNKSSVKNYG